MSGSLALILIGLAVPMCCDANLTRLLDLVFALGDFSLCLPILNDGNNMKVDCWFDLLPTMSRRVNFENPVDGWWWWTYGGNGETVEFIVRKQHVATDDSDAVEANRICVAKAVAGE
jgi:hypothetical protein